MTGAHDLTEAAQPGPPGIVRSSDGLGVTQFAPSVMVEGRELTPAGWMWVLAFAMAGCEWADAEIRKPEFRAKVCDWTRKRKAAEAETEIAYLEKRIEELKAQMTPNANSQTPPVR